MIDLRASPATERFDRDGVGGQMMLAPIQIAGTGDGDALGHGIKASLTFKFLLKGFTTRFQQGDIGLTVVDHFLLEWKDTLRRTWSVCQQVSSSFFLAIMPSGS